MNSSTTLISLVKHKNQEEESQTPTINKAKKHKLKW